MLDDVKMFKLHAKVRAASGRRYTYHRPLVALVAVEEQLKLHQEMNAMPARMSPHVATIVRDIGDDLARAYKCFMRIAPDWLFLPVDHEYRRLADVSNAVCRIPWAAPAVFEVRMARQKKLLDLIDLWTSAIRLGGVAIGGDCSVGRATGGVYRTHPWWRTLRRPRSYALAGGLCQCCGSLLLGKFELHHREGIFFGLGSYDWLGCEPDDALEVLCSACHDPTAGRRNTPPGRPARWSEAGSWVVYQHEQQVERERIEALYDERERLERFLGLPLSPR